MAVRPGNRFSFDDLGELIASANDRSSSVFDLSGFTDAVPMYYDLAGAKYGFRRLTGFKVITRGAGYAPGDKLSAAGLVVRFEVVAVDGSGGITGLLVTQNIGFGPTGSPSTSPAWPAYQDPVSPCRFYDGSDVASPDRGARLTFEVVQVGPSYPYALVDYQINDGEFTDFFVVDGGIGYAPGNTLSVPGALVGTLAPLPVTVSTVELVGTLAPLPVTVSTVDGAGKILTIALPNMGFIGLKLPIPPQPMETTGGSGSGATIGGMFVLYQKPNWLAELNRLRANLYSTPLVNGGSDLLSEINPPDACVSGPWPVGAPTANFEDTWFWFADTGSTESVTTATGGFYSSGVFSTAVQSAWIETYSPFGTHLVLTPLIHITAQAISFVVGGIDPIHVVGTFIVYRGFYRGGTYSTSGYDPDIFTLDSVDPTTLIDVVPNTNGDLAMPGTLVKSWSTLFGSYNGEVKLVWTVDAWLSPGRYGVTLNTTLPGDDPPSYPGTSSTIHPAFTRLALGVAAGGVDAMMQFSGTAGFTYSSAVSAPGIHNSKQVLKINLPGNEFKAGAGMFGVKRYPYNDYLTAPYPQPLFGPEMILTGAMSVSTSTPGFWTAKTQPVSNLNIVPASAMPWNQVRTRYGSSGSASVNPTLLGDLATNVSNVGKISNSYDQTKTVEAQIEPPGWIASRFFSSGFTIIDSNGNLQQATNDGISGAYQPSHTGSTSSWSRVLNGVTNDGGVAWKCVQVFEPNPIASAQHRIPDLPRYPFYWASETVARLKPPTSTSGLTIWGAWDQWRPVNSSAPGGYADPGWQQQWTAGQKQLSGPHASDDLKGMAYGWWLYSVSINRVAVDTSKSKYAGPVPVYGAGSTSQPGAGDDGGTGSSGVGAGGSAGPGPTVSPNEIFVTIGCLRSGSFVAFGTFITGQTYQVLWPVFTSDALVYQCAERIDLQALAIARPNYVTSGQAVTTPLCAASITDTIKLLQLIN